MKYISDFVCVSRTFQLWFVPHAFFALARAFMLNWKWQKQKSWPWFLIWGKRIFRWLLWFMLFFTKWFSFQIFQVLYIPYCYLFLIQFYFGKRTYSVRLQCINFYWCLFYEPAYDLSYRTFHVHLKMCVFCSYWF